jgi:DnaK suppressor protein
MHATFTEAAVRDVLTRELDDVLKRVRRLDAALRSEAGESVAGATAADVFDQAQSVATREAGRVSVQRLTDRVRRLRAALARLDDGRYGECEQCDALIEPRRLRALPDATTCVRCQRAGELGRRMRRSA